MSNYLPTDYQTFIATSRYARWLDNENRRENWGETVERYMLNIVHQALPNWMWSSDSEDWHDTLGDLEIEIRDAILSLEVMPSMRSLMTAGPAADRDNTCMYNCSYIAVDDKVAFDEAMFVLLCGTGVGFSVERQFIDKLPVVPKLTWSDDVVVVKDSKEGWAKAFRALLALLWAGQIPKWDMSKVRPAGARLKTFGGRASGPAPLIDLFNFAVTTFKGAQERQLSSIECHDLMCKVGEVVVVGGVRRSAMISLSNLSDDQMRHAKSGEWWDDEAKGIKRHGYRSLANNSTAYTKKPDALSFIREWTSLIASNSGERGIFNRQAAKNQAAKNGRRKSDEEFGTNPCSEIILLSGQVCNLTEAVIRATDSLEDIERKIRIATILGTIQATYVKFPYLRKMWTTNTSKERLLGVSLTGIMDNPLLTLANKGLSETLEHLKQVAVDTNKLWAERLGIPQSAAISCVKPSGTVSQLASCASGIHARHSPFYIRTVRGDNKDPLTQFMQDQGIPSEPEMQKPDKTTVFSFPVKSPEGSVCTQDMSAIEQLDMWLMYQRHWCEHKPSVTINVKTDEWLEVGAYVYKHFDEMSGVSFLPFSEHIYQQAPYTDVSKDTYDELLAKMPGRIDWSKLSEYELEDTTTGMSTMACSGDSCEIVDISA